MLKRLQTLGNQVAYYLIVILLLSLLWLSETPVFAADFTTPQEYASVEVEPSLLRQSLDADDISAEKISQFVQAYLQVLELIERRETELQGAELESESQQIQREIEAQALEAIQNVGLTLQEYLQLLSLTNIDPEFGERVAAQFQEVTY